MTLVDGLNADDEHLFDYILKNGLDLIVTLNDSYHEVLNVLHKKANKLTIATSGIEIPLAGRSFSAKRMKIDFTVGVRTI